MAVSTDVQGPFRDKNSGQLSVVRFRRMVLLIATLGLITGVGLLTAGFALAGVGSELGNLSLSPDVGPTSDQPTWSTSDGCPANYQKSAELADFTTSGTLISQISPVVSAGLTAGFGGTLDFNMSSLASTGGFGSGGTVEFAVGCWNGAGGTGTGSTPVVYTQSIYVTVTPNGEYFTGNSASPTSTSTSTSDSTSTSTSPSTSPSPSPSTSTSPSPSSTLPSGGPQTGFGGAARPGGPSDLLIALGAAATLGSATAMGLATRRSRKPAEENGQGDGTSGAS